MFSFLIAFSVGAWCAPRADAQTTAGKPIRVVTRIVPPLVTTGPDGALTGFSIDLWRAIAHDANLPFEFIVKNTLPDLLAAVRDGQADAAVAAVSITAQREEEFDFSQPVLESGLQIVVREPGTDASIRDSLAALVTSPALYELLGFLLVLALVPVPLIWLAERRHAGEFLDERSHRRSFGKALWWSLATLGGQADEMPRSLAGRAVAVLCIFGSVLFVSYFTATATSIVTVRQLSGAIRGPADLPGRAVGTVTDSTAAAYLANEGVRRVLSSRIEDALAQLDKGDVDAVVYDAPVLQYYASHAGRGRVQVVGPVFRNEDYGVLLPSGSPLRKTINGALLALRESGGYRAIHANWFGQ